MKPWMRTAATAALFPALSLAAQGTSPAAVVSTESGGVNVQTLAPLDNPWGMTVLPDGRLLITEKPGRLRLYANGQLSEPIAGVPKVVHHGQGGLLDVEIDPDFERNGLVYLSYAEAAEEQPKDARDPGDPRFGAPNPKADATLKGAAVARGRLVGQELRDVTVVWRQVPKTIGRGHFGGRLVFSPDGTLYIMSGDRQRFDPAQDLATNIGKVVRINPDGSIPNDNPFVKKQGARPDVWTLGQRNALGAAIRPGTTQLWINEMGPKGGDEVNLVVPGRNYGWPLVSNGDNYDDSPIPDHPTRPDLEPPLTSWNPSISPSGLLFYTGDLFRAWHGDALIGGLSSKALIRLRLDAKGVTAEERIKMDRRIRDVAQAPDGAVLLLIDGKEGALVRLTPAGAGQ